MRTHAARFDVNQVMPLYLHDAILLVRKGNPKQFKNPSDFINRDGKMIMNDGAGTSNTSGTGVWEDILGRMGNVEKMAPAFAKISPPSHPIVEPLGRYLRQTLKWMAGSLGRTGPSATQIWAMRC